MSSANEGTNAPWYLINGCNWTEGSSSKTRPRSQVQETNKTYPIHCALHGKRLGGSRAKGTRRKTPGQETKICGYSHTSGTQ